MARYGAFLLQDGCWDGARLLPEGWMARASIPASTVDGVLVDTLDGSLPGWNLWVNHTHPAVHAGNLPWPDAPEGTFAALGHWRQAIYVMPEHGVVVARTGDDRDGSYQHNDFLRRVTAFVEAVPLAKPAILTPAPAAAVPATDDDGAAGAVGDAADGAGEEGTAAAAEEAPNVADGEALAAATVRGFTPAAFPPPPVKERVPAGGVPPEKYDVGLLSIATSFAALHGCACRYTSERSEDACHSYIRIQPDVAKARFKDDTETVVARALGMAKTKARPGPDGTGCRLVD
ncbi:MAG: hypothetical protein CL927_10475 [Deltaproteobacteria bacterium]|nr:hypothetical protein [Deltaproteobacteria bacterium]HCH63029.1 hypothetical protein [Deltaproteobacteria bacterium]